MREWLTIFLFLERLRLRLKGGPLDLHLAMRQIKKAPKATPASL